MLVGLNISGGIQKALNAIFCGRKYQKKIFYTSFLIAERYSIFCTTQRLLSPSDQIVLFTDFALS